MATRFVKITVDDVEILIKREENENTRKKNKYYAEHSSANMKQVVSLEMESIQRSHKSLPSTSSTALFHDNYITRGTFNVHVAANSSTESNTTVSQSPKSKDFVGFVESSDSSQGDSQYVTFFTKAS